MNQQKLQQAQERFLEKYPGGFMDPEFEKIGKKHKMEQMVALTQESFAKGKFTNAHVVCDAMRKLIGRSSMVSMFEKPKFRDFVSDGSSKTLTLLANGLNHFLHGDQQKGFAMQVDALAPYKLAKWSLVTILPNYYRPNDEVFVKPTTAKGVIEHFELEGLVYKPKPSWAFYESYRTAILQMKKSVHVSLKPSNAAFCGFLMMSL